MSILVVLALSSVALAETVTLIVDLDKKPADQVTLKAGDVARIVWVSDYSETIVTKDDIDAQVFPPSFGEVTNVPVVVGPATITHQVAPDSPRPTLLTIEIDRAKKAPMGRRSHQKDDD